jgi:hypothetical protein
MPMDSKINQHFSFSERPARLAGTDLPRNQFFFHQKPVNHANPAII